MHRNDNYNEVYQQLISQGFFDSIGNGVMKGVKGIGKGISSAWKWNKKRVAKKQINSNIDQIINNSIQTINTALADNQDNLKDASIIINQSVNDINNTLPESIIKTFLNDVKKIGNDTGDLITSSNKVNGKNVKTFLDQKINNLRSNLNINFLKSTAFEESYNDAYLTIIKEENDYNMLKNEWGFVHNLKTEELKNSKNICSQISAYIKANTNNKKATIEKKSQQIKDHLNWLQNYSKKIIENTQSIPIIDNTLLEKLNNCGSSVNKISLNEALHCFQKNINCNKQCALLFGDSDIQKGIINETLVKIMDTLSKTSAIEKIQNDTEMQKALNENKKIKAEIQKNRATLEKKIEAAVAQAELELKEIKRNNELNDTKHKHTLSQMNNDQELKNAIHKNDMQKQAINNELAALDAEYNKASTIRKAQIDKAKDELELKLQGINAETDQKELELKKLMSETEYQKFKTTREKEIETATIKANLQHDKADAEYQDFNYERQQILKQRQAAADKEAADKKVAEDEKIKADLTKKEKEDNDAKKLNLVKELAQYQTISLNKTGITPKLLKAFKKDKTNTSNYNLSSATLTTLVNQYFTAGILNAYNKTSAEAK